MTSLQTYNIFAFKRGEDERDELRRNIPDWRLEEALRWALNKGLDGVLIEASDGPPSSTGSKDIGRYFSHHVCSDSKCPGGCFDDND